MKNIINLCIPLNYKTQDRDVIKKIEKKEKNDILVNFRFYSLSGSQRFPFFCICLSP